MKKNLTFLTGIVFLYALLVAVGCSSGDKKAEAVEVTAPPAEKELAMANDDSTTVRIYLKARLIKGIMHLEMSNEKHPDWGVIDDLVTVVHPRDTVKWMKAPNSKIRSVEYIEIKEVYGPEFKNEVRPVKDLHELIIPDSIAPGIIVYEIGFTVVNDPNGKDTTYVIDPYLRLPKQTE